MFEKINKKSLVAFTLIGTMTIAGATTTFAADRANTSKYFAKNGKSVGLNITQMSDQIKAALDKLVSVGTISQAQEDAVLKVFTAKGVKGGQQGGPRGDHKNPMEALITAGTITQAQADSIKSAMDAGRASKTTIIDVLAGLVKAGTITQVQSDAISKAMPANLPPQNGDRGHGKMHTNPMSDLVTAGTITQAQADSIKSAMDAGRTSKKTMETVFAELVKAGTITQAQSDAITKAMPARDGKMGPQGERKSPLDELVTEGTINQTQADAINAAMKAVFDAAHNSK